MAARLEPGLGTGGMAGVGSPKGGEGLSVRAAASGMFPFEPLGYDRIRALKTEAYAMMSELAWLAESFSVLRKSGEADFVLRLGGARITSLEDRLRAVLKDLTARREAVETAIDSLPDRERLIMRLRYVEGLTWPEVAKQSNYSERSAHYIHGSALKLLGKGRKRGA